MSKKSRSRGAAASGDDHEDLARPPPLQAVLLADSFTLKFRPITLERPKVLPASRILRQGRLETLCSLRGSLSKLCCCPFAGVAAAGAHADDRVHAHMAGVGGGGRGLRLPLRALPPGQGIPGQVRVGREGWRREHVRHGRRVARRH